MPLIVMPQVTPQEQFQNEASKLRNKYQEEIRDLARQFLQTSRISVDVTIFDIPKDRMPDNSKNLGKSKYARINGLVMFSKR